MLAADTHKNTCAHEAQKKKIISFKCSKANGWNKFSPYLLTVVLPLVIKSQWTKGSQYIPITKSERFVIFPLSALPFFFFDENMPFFFSRRRTRAGGGETNMHANTVTLSLKKKEKSRGKKKMPEPPTEHNLKRRHLTVTNQIRSVIEFSISAELIRENNNSEWHISEGGDFKEQHQGIPGCLLSPSSYINMPLSDMMYYYYLKTCYERG